MGNNDRARRNRRKKSQQRQQQQQQQPPPRPSPSATTTEEEEGKSPPPLPTTPPPQRDDKAATSKTSNSSASAKLTELVLKMKKKAGLGDQAKAPKATTSTTRSPLGSGGIPATAPATVWLGEGGGQGSSSAVRGGGGGSASSSSSSSSSSPPWGGGEPPPLLFYADDSTREKVKKRGKADEDVKMKVKVDNNNMKRVLKVKASGNGEDDSDDSESDYDTPIRFMTSPASPEKDHGGGSSSSNKKAPTTWTPSEFIGLPADIMAEIFPNEYPQGGGNAGGTVPFETSPLMVLADVAAAEVEGGGGSDVVDGAAAASAASKCGFGAGSNFMNNNNSFAKGGGPLKTYGRHNKNNASQNLKVGVVQAATTSKLDGSSSGGGNHPPSGNNFNNNFGGGGTCEELAAEGILIDFSISSSSSSSSSCGEDGCCFSGGYPTQKNLMAQQNKFTSMYQQGQEEDDDDNPHNTDTFGIFDDVGGGGGDLITLLPTTSARQLDHINYYNYEYDGCEPMLIDFSPDGEEEERGGGREKDDDSDGYMIGNLGDLIMSQEGTTPIDPFQGMSSRPVAAAAPLPQRMTIGHSFTEGYSTSTTTSPPGDDENQFLNWEYGNNNKQKGVSVVGVEQEGQQQQQHPKPAPHQPPPKLDFEHKSNMTMDETVKFLDRLFKIDRKSGSSSSGGGGGDATNKKVAEVVNLEEKKVKGKAAPSSSTKTTSLNNKNPSMLDFDNDLSDVVEVLKGKLGGVTTANGKPRKKQSANYLISSEVLSMQLNSASKAKYKSSELGMILESLSRLSSSYTYDLTELSVNNKSNKLLNKQFCSLEGCKKEAFYKCPVCDMYLYCSAKHQRDSKDRHRVQCGSYRVIDSHVFGKHIIAGRDYKSYGEMIMLDDPQVILPFNPSLVDSLNFSNNYCIICFTHHGSYEEDDDYAISVGEKKSRLGFGFGTRLCPRGCGMRVCSDGNACSGSMRKPPKSQSKMPTHFDNECKIITHRLYNTNNTFNKERKKPSAQHSIPLLHFMRAHNHVNKEHDVATATLMTKMINSISPKAVKDGLASPQSGKKLKELRDSFEVTPDNAEDEDIVKLDCVMKKFGRNCGADVLAFFNGGSEVVGGGAAAAAPGRQHPQQSGGEDGSHVHKYVKCIYANAGYIIHSCQPNSLLLINPDYCVRVHTLREVKKGEVITVCYDDRVLFMPIWKRRQYLVDQFDFLCKCKRCSSASESDTYFSGFPCSVCAQRARRSHTNSGNNNGCGDVTTKKGRSGGPKNKSFVVPEEPPTPANPYPDWTCTHCKSKRIPHLKALYTLNYLKTQLDFYVRNCDPFGLKNMMNLLVEQNYLHWNHFLIFEYSLKVFAMVWELMKNRNDLEVIKRFSESRGLEFLGIAEVVLGLSREFLPHGYMESHVLPLRLAAIIKLRDLTNQLTKGSSTTTATTLRRIDPTIASIYFRSKSDTISYPLYQRSNRDGSDLTMQFIEAKVLRSLARVIVSNSSNSTSTGKKSRLDVLDKEAPYLAQVFKSKFGKCTGVGISSSKDETVVSFSFLKTIIGTEEEVVEKSDPDTFPWNLVV